MKNLKLLFISAIFLLVGTIIMSWSILRKINEYEVKQQYLSEQLSYENRLLNAWEWIPFTNESDGKVKTWQELEKSSMADYNGALVYGGILCGIVVLFILINVIYYREQENSKQAFGILFIFSALAFLYLGLTAPLIEIMVYVKDLTVEFNISDLGLWGSFLDEETIEYLKYLDIERTIDGRTYILYQNKSILELIYLLFRGGNFLLAIVVLVASILFPVAKLLLSLIALLRPNKKSSFTLYNIIKSLGKWSMIDVFMAATYLAVFSFASMEREGVDLGSYTLIGMYFFLFFIAFSINSGKYLKATIKKAQQLGYWDID